MIIIEQNKDDYIRGHRANNMIEDWGDCKLSKEDMDEVLKPFAIEDDIKYETEEDFWTKQGVPALYGQITFKNGSEINAIPNRNTIRSSRAKNPWLYASEIEQMLGLRLKWYQRLWLRACALFYKVIER